MGSEGKYLYCVTLHVKAIILLCGKLGLSLFSCPSSDVKIMLIKLYNCLYCDFNTQMIFGFFCIRTNFKPKISLHNHLSRPGIYKHKKYSSNSLYRGSSSMTSKSHVRPRGQTMTEQVKENQMTQSGQSFPLNSN